MKPTLIAVLDLPASYLSLHSIHVDFSDHFIQCNFVDECSVHISLAQKMKNNNFVSLFYAQALNNYEPNRHTQM